MKQTSLFLKIFSFAKSIMFSVPFFAGVVFLGVTKTPLSEFIINSLGEGVIKNALGFLESSLFDSVLSAPGETIKGCVERNKEAHDLFVALETPGITPEKLETLRLELNAITVLQDSAENSLNNDPQHLAWLSKALDQSDDCFSKGLPQPQPMPEHYDKISGTTAYSAAALLSVVVTILIYCFTR